MPPDPRRAQEICLTALNANLLAWTPADTSKIQDKDPALHMLRCRWQVPLDNTFSLRGVAPSIRLRFQVLALVACGRASFSSAAASSVREEMLSLR